MPSNQCYSFINNHPNNHITNLVKAFLNAFYNENIELYWLIESMNRREFKTLCGNCSECFAIFSFYLIQWKTTNEKKKTGRQRSASCSCACLNIYRNKCGTKKSGKHYNALFCLFNISFICDASMCALLLPPKLLRLLLLLLLLQWWFYARHTIIVKILKKYS